MKLTALAVSGYQTVLYKSYVMPESLSNVSQHHPVTAISALHCGFNCMSEEGCYGLTYDWLTKKCSSKSCVNPNLYSEGQSGGYDFYIRADVGDNFSNLLARNKNNFCFNLCRALSHIDNTNT
ncbi:hypothetical protein EB796_008298 [Bugula neritina]|uniref:Apple domain-containing protein n=1 Tax=Bugula neritina TaxID=10212 RepID=A0A7J7K605_BUGNE|nr:hypothetical protein EB796_008298 [Bugula neritina]